MQSKTPTFPSLEQETRATLPTAEAAFHLHRKPQTMRVWAMRGGLINPIRINGRLAWPTAQIRKIVGGAA